MSFRDREKARLAPLKPQLFSSESIATQGVYKDAPRDFCLVSAHSAENVWRGCREEALAYFANRVIRWHDGLGELEARPSNHLCCSQTACVNALMPFRQAPDALAAALRSLDFPVKRVLPFEADRPGEDGTPAQPGQLGVAGGYVAFEWIGTRNYLGEGPGGRPLADDGRSRGRHATSADFAIRFEDHDGAIRLLLGEWKYTESYSTGADKRFGKPNKAGAQTDRLQTYGSFLADPACPIVLPAGIAPEHLLFDPFDQLMRLQLLAWQMEGRELGATQVSVVHVAPTENSELDTRLTAPALGEKYPGSTVHDVWSKLVPSGKFRPLPTRTLLEALVAQAPDSEWGEYMRVRYLGMA